MELPFSFFFYCGFSVSQAFQAYLLLPVLPMLKLVAIVCALCCAIVRARVDTQVPTLMSLRSCLYVGLLSAFFVVVGYIARLFYLLSAARKQAKTMEDTILCDVSAQENPKRPPIPITPISRAEVAKHNKKSDCWIVVHNLVLDVTEYMPLHPGGERTISVYAGQDATTCYDSKHYPDTIELYAPEVIIGQVAD